MTRLEDYIKQHHDEFDSNEPSEDHLLRFEQRLTAAAASSNSTSKVKMGWLKVAAVAIFVSLSGVLYYQLQGSDDYSQQIRVIRNTYNDVLDTKYKEINIAVEKLPESVQRDYERQIENLKKQTELMEHNSQLGADNPKVRQSLILHYRQTDKMLTRMAIRAEKSSMLHDNNQ